MKANSKRSSFKRKNLVGQEEHTEEQKEEQENTKKEKEMEFNISGQRAVFQVKLRSMENRWSKGKYLSVDSFPGHEVRCMIREGVVKGSCHDASNHKSPSFF